MAQQGNPTLLGAPQALAWPAPPTPSLGVGAPLLCGQARALPLSGRVEALLPWPVRRPRPSSRPAASTSASSPCPVAGGGHGWHQDGSAGALSPPPLGSWLPTAPRLRSLPLQGGDGPHLQPQADQRGSSIEPPCAEMALNTTMGGGATAPLLCSHPAEDRALPTFISTSPLRSSSKQPNSSRISLVMEETWIFKAGRKAGSGEPTRDWLAGAGVQDAGQGQASCLQAGRGQPWGGAAGSPSPLDSMRDAVLTVSPKRQ